MMRLPNTCCSITTALTASISKPALKVWDRTGVQSPSGTFQNPFPERVIGSIRRECLDHLIIINENHLRHILSEYFYYYHEARPHQSFAHNSPHPREFEPQSKSQVISIPQVGGLRHRYRRVA
jgi:putative transposase